MTIRMKIMLALVLMAVIGLTLGVVGLVTANNMTDLSKQLHALETEGRGASGVLSAHYRWRHSVAEAVLSESEFTGQLDPNLCALGTWITSDVAKNITDPEVLSKLEEIKAPHNLIHTEARRVKDYLEIGDVEAARHELLDLILPTTQKVIDLLTEISDKYEHLIEDKSVEIEDFGALMSTVIISLIVLAVLLCVVLAVLVTKSIVKPLLPLAAFMGKAGTTGDIALTQQDIEVISKYTAIKDEIGTTINNAAAFVKHVTDVSNILSMIADGDISGEAEVLSDKDMLGLSIQKMLINLNQMFSDINSSSSQVSVGAGEVAQGSQALAQGSTEQAASVEQLSASINEISVKTKENAEMANQASELSQDIRVHAEKESGQMDLLMKAVLEITEASNAISKVIKVIDDIAFQTNILALNAAVEAARAGQHGKGFAVVAEEVRNLAAKSAASAKDTGSLIENSIQKSNLGLSIATETAESLKEVVASINKSAEIVTLIASSSEEQSAAISQVTVGIDQVSQVIQQNSATAEESAAASEQMSGQATILQDLVKQFKLKDEGSAFQLPPKSL
ncbi:MAG: methyl-accepting chemotaxis protein [Oscillospiraceae bacterium]|nr:methyl-accepting chemotaxis protein [Oscillospiraceae bacterium]